jgi:hypothetical protein
MAAGLAQRTVLMTPKCVQKTKASMRSKFLAASATKAVDWFGLSTVPRSQISTSFLLDLWASLNCEIQL